MPAATRASSAPPPAARPSSTSSKPPSANSKRVFELEHIHRDVSGAGRVRFTAILIDGSEVASDGLGSSPHASAAPARHPPASAIVRAA